MAEDVAGQGHIPCNERINVEEASEAEVMMLRDNFLRFANDNFRTATVTILTKDYANEFKEISSPLPSIDFHLQFIQATFVSWSRSDPRVSKEILKGKVLPSSSSNNCLTNLVKLCFFCFFFQSTKPEATESTRLLIGFSDVLGLQITEDSIVLDVRSLPKMERKVTYQLGRHSATQRSIIEADFNQKSGGKWTEQCIVASDKPPYRITVGLMRQREVKFRQLKELLLKIPPLKRSEQPMEAYRQLTHCVRTSMEIPRKGIRS